VSYFTTALAEDELLLEVRVPKLGPGWGWGFVEVSRRPGDFALVAVAALVRAVGSEVVEARVALGGVAERPVRAAAVEMAIGGAGPGDVNHRVGPIEGIEPVGDTGATAEHRRHLARVLVVRALEDALARAGAAA
jgi:carbon-monoxide dehydrogenase medium subunit